VPRVPSSTGRGRGQVHKRCWQSGRLRVSAQSAVVYWTRSWAGAQALLAEWEATRECTECRRVQDAVVGRCTSDIARVV
jgi:hypothetical protein